MTEPMGNDIVVIIKRIHARDDNGNPRKSPKGIAIVTEDRIEKSGCSFQSQRESKRTSDVVIGEVKAHCYMPVDDDTSTITDRDGLEFRGQLFEMEGPAMVRTDQDTGDPVHVKCVAWWVRGDGRTN